MAEQTVATLGYVLLAIGLLNRKRRFLHVAFMGSGIAVDTALVLTLQIQRGVIQDAMTVSYSLLERCHILTSSAAFALYVPVVFLGLRQLLGRGSPRGRRWHVRVALTAFVLRSLGFGLMFSF